MYWVILYVIYDNLLVFYSIMYMHYVQKDQIVVYNVWGETVKAPVALWLGSEYQKWQFAWARKTA